MKEIETLPELPENIREEVDSLLRHSGEAERAGNLKDAEDYADQAWDKLPEPKLGWNFYSNVMPKGNLVFFTEHRQFDKALHWLEITRESYGPGPNQVIEFMAAVLFYEMGEFDKAYDLFDWEYTNWKTLPFKGEDKKYLDFYLDEKKKRGKK